MLNRLATYVVLYFIFRKLVTLDLLQESHPLLKQPANCGNIVCSKCCYLLLFELIYWDIKFKFIGILYNMGYSISIRSEPHFWFWFDNMIYVYSRNCINIFLQSTCFSQFWHKCLYNVSPFVFGKCYVFISSLTSMIWALKFWMCRDIQYHIHSSLLVVKYNI